MRFHLDTQTDGSEYGYPPRFYTRTQWAEKQLGDDAQAYLHEHGIQVRYDSPWRGREVELANILRNVT